MTFFGQLVSRFKNIHLKANSKMCSLPGGRTNNHYCTGVVPALLLLATTLELLLPTIVVVVVGTIVSC